MNQLSRKKCDMIITIDKEIALLLKAMWMYNPKNHREEDTEKFPVFTHVIDFHKQYKAGTKSQLVTKLYIELHHPQWEERCAAAKADTTKVVNGYTVCKHALSKQRLPQNEKLCKMFTSRV